MLQKYFKISLLNFLIAACLGAILRYAFVVEIPWIDFRNMLHGHSHVAMLGWIYLALFTLLLHSFLSEKQRASLFYKRLFLLTQISVIGMFISFPLQGYGAWSIAFSQAHVFFSYAFAFRFLKDLKERTPTPGISTQFVKFSIYFLLLSTLALWALPPIMILKLQGTAFFYATIQFYLHFQFNGWFIFACLALLFKFLEGKGFFVKPKSAKNFLILLTVSCLLTYLLAVIWSTPLPALFVLNSLGVLLQLLALVLIFIYAKRHFSQIKKKVDRIGLRLIQIGFFSFVLKILVQSIVIIPQVATISLTIRNFVIGFIHLILLGAISHFLFAFAHNQGLFIIDSRQRKIGIWLFTAGFVLSELFLFIQGSLLWASHGFFPYYYEGLAGVSSLIPLGLLFLISSRSGENRN